MKYVLKFPERPRKLIAEEYDEHNVVVARFEIRNEIELNVYREMSEKLTNRKFRLYEALEINPDAVTF